MIIWSFIAVVGAVFALLISTETYFCVRRVVRELIDGEEEYIRRIVREELAAAKTPPGEDAAAFYGIRED